MLKAMCGAGTVALAGCSGGEDENGTGGDGSDSNQAGDDGESSGWTEADLSSEVEYNFPEGERINYESDPPVEVKELNAVVQGREFEVRGTLAAKEMIPQLVEISVDFHGDGHTGDSTAAPFAQPTANDEHSFTVSFEEFNDVELTGFTLILDGPEPQ
ncbi:hypothetical protein [Halorubrum saccharovorum]|uniref:hypothetical protein n=1 Tax=Halorubrum saccharovorum TaxID=2248 RepID=UPI00128C02F8|nr:hypothetical protein [Halorubrum saccharovorum]